jgi:flavorubredoxin
MGTGWIVTVGIAALLVGAAAWLYYSRNREVVSGVTTLNAGGEAGAALVVYHPGRSDFARRVIGGFAQGLVSRGWRVDLTTASLQAPADLSAYDLLVLGGPTYGFTPNQPIRRYLSRLGDLGGQRTATVVTAMGAGERSAAIMGRQVREANGELVESLLLYWMRPNDDDNYVDVSQNRDLAVELATQAAQRIPLPDE